ncbi:MAG: SusC/RagA family TonB-linked outer membrane protein [Ignavibacteriae bacterium]|nr:SusC/RagA family TonB-linked outer membrane protein [Ignavibacteriota bacterium]MCB9215143.1 SusC/RagA family TonB-linked outer membrane protein [Ignavibacteria bacterium]
MTRFYSLLFLFLLAASVSMAQSISVGGRVEDGETGEPIPGVSVVERGTSNGTATNANGEYTLKLSSDSALLIFSSIGYLTQEEKARGRSTINVQLVAEALELNEVVVTALNLKRESRALGYAVQKLNSTELSEVKSPNFVDNLAGRVAGVTVTQGATGVGSMSKVTIRGEASFTNNNPLFVVDGVPINNNTNFNRTNEAAAGFQEVDFGNGGMELNQDDIASVTLLKGPSAAALYGTRAANGVVIVTTKDGSRSKELGVSFSSSVFFDQPFQLPEFQNRYGQGNSGQFEFVDGLGGGVNDNISYSWGPALDQGTLIPQFDSPVTLPNGTVVRGGDLALRGGALITPTPFTSHPDNLKDFYETGVTAINNLAISSGFDKGSYRLSFTDLRSDSYIPGVNLKRKTVAGRMVFTPAPELDISTSINYINSSSDNRPANGYGSENINYALVAWGPRSMNTENLKEYWQPNLEGIEQFSFNYTFFDNPYFTLLENRNGFGRDRLFGGIAATYDFTEQLSLTFNSGMDYSNELRTFRRNYSSNRFKTGAYAEQEVFFREINNSFLLNYTTRFGDLSTEISAGGNRMDQNASTKQTEALSLAQPGIFNFANAASPLGVTQYEAKKRINSLYGFAKFGYKNFLYLDITGRNDWSSALATSTSTANTSFFYPSASMSYILSNTVELPSWISFAKLRGSWAEVGNDTDPYQTSLAFLSGTPYNSQPTATAQNVIPNSNLLPEKTSAVEVGADLRFFNDRLRLDLTYYNALTENQIISFPVAISSGFSQQVVNGGSVRSKGVEIVAEVTPVVNQNFEWNATVNFSSNRATVESLPEGADRITLAYSRIYDNVNQTVWFQVEEGGEIGDMYGTGYLKNEEGKFVIDANGNFVADNRLRKLGNYNPDFILGFNNTFRYKEWDASFLIDWRQGGELVSRTFSLAMVGGQLRDTENRPEEGIVADGVVNVGTDANPIWEQNSTAISAERYYRQYYDRNHEENNIYSATYVKLRQFSVGYTFRGTNEGGILKRGRNVRLALIGRNLFALSEIPHFDPEQLAVQGTRFVGGVEDMSYPSSRSFGIKLDYNF